MTQTLNSQVIARLEINYTEQTDHYELVVIKAKEKCIIYLAEAEAKELSDKLNLFIQND